MKRESNDVELSKRRIAFQREQRYGERAQLSLHIGPRRVYSFGGPTLTRIQEAVQNLETQMAHPDLIGVGEAQCDSGRNLGGGFKHLVPLAAGVSRRLFDTRKDLVQQASIIGSFIHANSAKTAAAAVIAPA